MNEVLKTHQTPLTLDQKYFLVSKRVEPFFSKMLDNLHTTESSKVTEDQIIAIVVKVGDELNISNKIQLDLIEALLEAIDRKTDVMNRQAVIQVIEYYLQVFYRYESLLENALKT